MSKIDIVVPNSEKIFDQIRPLFKRYYFLSKISLDEILSNEFIELFVKSGSLYLHSFNTKLDCDDCVCLLPNGDLVMNVTHSTNQKIPVEWVKKSVKSSGYHKYGICSLVVHFNKPKDLILIEQR